MTPFEWVMLLITLIFLAICVTGYVCYRIGYSDGDHNGRTSERNRQNMRRLRESRAAAVTSPASAAPPWYVKVEGVSIPGARRHRHVTAIPPQPGRLDHPAGTVRFPALITNTGEFRAAAKARTDDWIERMDADGDAYRAQIRQELAT